MRVLTEMLDTLISFLLPLPIQYIKYKNEKVYFQI